MVGNLVGIWVVAILGSGTTFFVAQKPAWGPVKSSAVLTLIASTIFYGGSTFFNFDYLYYLAAFYGSTFVGMASVKVFNQWAVLFSGSIYAFVFYTCSPYFNGVGGTLGTAACLSCIVVYLLHLLRKKLFLNHV